jgi:hypothetical protein
MERCLNLDPTHRTVSWKNGGKHAADTLSASNENGASHLSVSSSTWRTYGVTPQSIAMTSKPELMITHAPGHMFICDPKDEDLVVL